jgi:hypothetical protein
MTRKFYYLCLFTLFLFCACKNPFGEDKISGARTSITGTISVSGVTKPSGVYVWLEQLNVGVFTDEKGEFILRLPTKAELPGIENLSGAFKLYFFTINFHLTTAEVLIRDGEFEFGKVDLDKNGCLSKKVLLYKEFLVSSEATVNEVFHYEKVDTNIYVRTIIKAAMGTVTVKIPCGTDKFLGGVFLHNLDTGKIQLSTSSDSLNKIYNFPVSVSTTGKMAEYTMKANNFKWMNEKYTVTPYILPMVNVPIALYKSIGFDPDYFNSAFIKILFDHQSNVF